MSPSDVASAAGIFAWSLAAAGLLTAGQPGGTEAEAPLAQPPRGFAVDDERSFEGEALGQGTLAETALVLEDGLAGVALAPRAHSGTCASPWIETPAPFREVLISWNVARSEAGGFAVTLRLRREDGSASSWYRLGRCGTHPLPGDAVTEDASAAVEVDWLRAHAPHTAYQWQVSLQRAGAGSASPRLDRVTVVASAPTPRPGPDSRPPAPPPAAPSGPLRLPVPFRSQRAEDPSIAGRICSPTSVAMVLEHHGVRVPTAEVARRAFDPDHDIYGNWPANVQAAYSLGVPGRVTRVRSWDAARAHLEAGRPLIASIRDPDGVLKNAPYQRTSGHLLVLTGFDEDGNVRVNDPAAPDATRGIAVYDRGAMEMVWLERGGIAYVLEAPPRPLAPAGSGGAPPDSARR